MTYETACEFESFLLKIEAAISTLDTIREHYCSDGDILLQGAVFDMDKDLWSVFLLLKMLHDQKREEVAKAYKAKRIEKTAEQSNNK